MKNTITARATAVAAAIAMLGGTPVALAQQGADSTVAGNAAADTRRDDDTDWGWLGLIGLAGLAGLRRKHDDNVAVRPSTVGR